VIIFVLAVEKQCDIEILVKKPWEVAEMQEEEELAT
jgi:hypothetical protein